MQWSVTSPPANPILTTDQLSYALRLDPDIAATGDEQSLVADYLAAATEYAQNAMSTSILTQTITAVFFNGDKLVLPRGPVQVYHQCGRGCVAIHHGHHQLHIAAPREYRRVESAERLGGTAHRGLCRGIRHECNQLPGRHPAGKSAPMWDLCMRTANQSLIRQ